MIYTKSNSIFQKAMKAGCISVADFAKYIKEIKH
jgi:hypothetical protein